MYRLYFDNQQIHTQSDFSDFREEIVRNDDIHGFFFQYPDSIKFAGDAYTYLKNRFDEGGYCQTISVLLQKVESNGTTLDIYGQIKVVDCDFNITEATVEAPIEDASYVADVYNNRKVDVSVESTITKYGNPMTGVTPIDIDFFDPQAALGTWYGTPDVTYKLKDCIQAVLDFITDGQVILESEFLDKYRSPFSQDTNELVLIYGVSLRNQTRNPLFLSFEEITSNLYKYFRMMWAMQVRDGQAYMIYEPESYFYGSESLQIDNVKTVKRSAFSDKLAATIKVGGKSIKELSPKAAIDRMSLGYYRMTGFTEEEFILEGGCNIDDSIDLSPDWISDSNIIEYCRRLQNDQRYDFDKFIVEVSTRDARATKYNYGQISTSTDRFYNQGLLNSSILKRHSFYGGIINVNEDDGDSFAATLTATLANQTNAVYSSFLIFDSELSDQNNNYSPITGYYTCPVNGRGNYAVQVVLRINVITNEDPLNNTLLPALRFIRHNGSSNVLTELVEGTPISGPTKTGEPFEFVFNFDTYLYDGDTIRIQHEHTLDRNNVLANFVWNIDKSSQYYSTAISEGGGIWTFGDTEAFKGTKYEFSDKLTPDQWRAYKFDLTKNVLFNQDGINNRKGWVKKVSRNLEGGQTDFELISDLKQTII